MQIGAQQAKISSLEKELENLRASQNSKILDLEKQINRLTEIARENADLLLQDRARKAGFIKGMHTTATLIGYSVIILALLVAGKFTGALDVFIKFVTSSIVK